MKTSEKGIDLLKVLEEGKGFSSKSYLCPAGKRTIGYGHVILPDDNIIEPIIIIHYVSLFHYVV